jgi:hypothetical protein
MVCVELPDDTQSHSTRICPATKAVLHYFKNDLGRTVSVGEFAAALESVMGFAAKAPPAAEPDLAAPRAEYDLCRLALESGQGRVSFHACAPNYSAPDRRRACCSSQLHGCVKQLTGARRRSLRCRTLEGEIVAYLRECLSAESAMATLPAGGVNGKPE